MQCFRFDHHHKYAFAALYTAVENPGEIKKKIIAASKAGIEEQETVNFAFVEAKLITSTAHLQTAIHQALLADSQGSLRTKTIHSEILWALNPTNNISEAIRRYGVSEASTALILVRISDSENWDGQARMDEIVGTTATPLEDLKKVTDWAKIKSYYRLEATCENDMVDTIVTSSVAMKSVMA
ncbi:CGI-121-domain-containing protein [Mycena floridula]|nr:CGI-121-domain-containing protein [Mycena floridula]